MQRRMLLAMLVLAIGAASACLFPAGLKAQGDCCLNIVNNTNCRLTICAKFGDVERCVTVEPNSATQFSVPCVDTPRFAVRNACNNLVPLTFGDCVVTPIGEFCCSRVCLGRRNGCIEIVATPSPIDCICAD
ncbi:MAG TPA: hypothetical protein VHI13_01645 [Candidatus Kapabacteria bacterium]|nr:hypothetical protein [Candidatus Kapabacteria bacterium]